MRGLSSMDIACLITFHLLLSKNHIFKSFFIDRVYSGRSNDDLSHLTSCVLIDEFEQSLKSKEDYHIPLKLLPNLKFTFKSMLFQPQETGQLGFTSKN